MNRREENIGRMPARGHASGLWTLEELDRPSPGWDELEKDRVKSAVPRDTRDPNDTRRVPVAKYPDAGSYRKPRNLAREWIAAHPAEWEAMCNGEELEPTDTIGTAYSRTVAAQQVQRYDTKKAAGKLAPSLDEDSSSYDGRVAFPETLQGPIGTRYDEAVAKRHAKP